MPNYPNRYARTSNRRRKQCYDVALELMETAEDHTVNQNEIVETLSDRFPRKSWNCKAVGGLLKPLVSSGLVLRVRKRVLGTMATYYTLDLFKYKETLMETHDVDGRQEDDGSI